MYKLVLLRHGESTWNKDNRFTGWTDIDLSERGIEEAHEAAHVLKENGFTFDIAYTSLLKRAIRTLWIVLDDMDLMWIPVVRNWRLNERMYGALQGLSKSEIAAEHGEEKVRIWRRSYDIPPPAIDKSDDRYPGRDPMYEDLDEDLIPLTECLKDTVARFMPYWYDVMEPAVLAGKRILVSAHGNSLRALVKHLDRIPDDEIIGLDIPTGIPLVYDLDEKLRPIKHYYLADEDEVKKAIQKVADQGKAKA